ncbi:MAG: nitroreductase family protein [Spirochaetia bacterium]
MEPIFKRKSIRAFTGEPVEKEVVEELLHAGMSAPSAGNERPWEFIVTQKRKNLDYLSGISPYAGALKTAGTAVVVLGDLQKEKFKGYWVQDCAAATENILIAATAHKLGSVWLGVYPMQERIDFLRKFYSLPSHITPFAIVALGYISENLEAKDRYSAERVHFEGFSG